VQNADSTYDGTMDVQAAYAMLDFPATEKLRLIGGARLESTDIHIDSVSYIGNGVTGLPVNQTDLQQTDVLPAVGLIYSITERMNLRLSYSQTIARPSFRELAAFRQYDPVLDVEADGNPRLVLSSIENYDLRWEWFPRPGDLLSVSLFYKSLKNPIERYSISADDKLITYINRDSGTSMGIEFEARTSLDRIHSLLSEFSLGANLTLIESETELTDTEFSNKTDSLGKVDRTRPLYDTSPYLANVDLSYDNIHSGTSASLVFNVAGPRIVFASQSKEDVYEQPAPVLDFVISQKIGRSLTVRFTAKNLLNPVIKRTYGEDEEDFKYSDPNTFETKSLPNLYSTSTRGITFGLSASYDF
jgi:TonB-dependent receptor